ncbi:hypothetical protein E2P81_ATG00204 [Venturia nashicola]|uniref:Uncharacterized protein n=1 Tax=Venturia nashicola TaxID=86259 RepID=A0A4Z1PHV9_9PEZI|nr:hypothetical protein E6O75_ATG00214 [Venturia nashicola]TLD39217.1 hypothetical protein E2P81_ATG00204 [Venturia nashicola]
MFRAKIEMNIGLLFTPKFSEMDMDASIRYGEGLIIYRQAYFEESSERHDFDLLGILLKQLGIQVLGMKEMRAEQKKREAQTTGPRSQKAKSRPVSN